ncbi:MAG: ATP-binding protein [Pseudomonadota bacterium]
MGWPVSTLRVYLVAVILVATVPLTGFALYLLHGQADDTRIERQTTLYRLANSLALALEREMASTADALNLLSRDAALQRGDIAEFQRNVQRWPLARPSWRALVLSDAGGRVLFATPGAAAPARLPQASGDTLHVTTLPGHSAGPTTAVQLPVQTANGRFLLAALIDARQWQKLIDQSSVPPDGFVSLVDRDTRVVATSRQPERFVGQQMPIERQAQLLGVGPGSPPGQPLLTLKQVGSTGWWVGAGMSGGRPAWAELATLWSVLVAGLLSLALGLVLALYVGRRVSGPLRQLARGNVAQMREHIVVREIAALRDALQAADRQRDQAMQALQAKADEYQALLQERLALVQREQDARHAAEEASRGKDEFLAMLGHELRNPLSAIAAAVEVINRVEPRHPSAQSARRVIARQTQQLVGLMNELTDMARASAGKIKLARQPLQLAPLVWRTQAALRLAGRFRHHALTLQLEDVKVEADPMRIEQVVSNLLTNAAKYTPPDGQITVTLRQVDGQAELVVEDTGMGIPPALLPRVFDAFVQGERGAERRQGGLGLGLTLVRRLVELHGGSVQASSAGSGQGSRFTVRLPAQQTHAAPHALQRPLLLVGTDEAALPVLESLLEEAPRRIAIAPDGAIALACLRHDPALRQALIVALSAPCDEQDEEEAAPAAWRQQAPEVRIVAAAEPGQEERCRSAGFDAVIPQPLSVQRLREQLSVATTSLAVAS